MKKRLFIWLLMCALLICGCAQKKESTQETTSLSAGQYLIYRVVSGDNSLQTECYTTESTDTYTLVQELFTRMKNASEGGVKAALPDDVKLDSYSLDGGTLSLDFTGDYAKLSDTEEVLVRAAVVYTMLQIPTVTGIQFYVSDQMLLDSSGKAMGIMTAESFQSSVNQSYNKKTITLYFADSTGQYLVPEERDVVYEAGDTLESVIVSELIEGPERADLQAVVAPSLAVSQVTISDNVCYIYFDSAFLDNTYELADYVPIYAFVNSLTEETYISRVQFVIGGSTDNTFRNDISLATPLSANLDYIKEN